MNLYVEGKNEIQAKMISTYLILNFLYLKTIWLQDKENWFST